MKYVLIFVLVYLSWVPAVNAQRGPFYEEIIAFKKQDSISHPAKHTILFAGSSSFRMWKNVQQDFPGYTIINRGFGGSSLPDVIRYADEILFPYEPRQIVIYCGDNDLAASDTVTAKMVVDRFRDLFFLIRKKMPKVSIIFVSIKPSPSRERLLPKVKEANAAIRTFLQQQRHTSYVDVFNKMTDKQGKINTELFMEDNLHMNAKGYAIWTKSIKPYLLKD